MKKPIIAMIFIIFIMITSLSTISYASLDDWSFMEEMIGYLPDWKDKMTSNGYENVVFTVQENKTENYTSRIFHIFAAQGDIYLRNNNYGRGGKGFVTNSPVGNIRYRNMIINYYNDGRVVESLSWRSTYDYYNSKDDKLPGPDIGRDELIIKSNVDIYTDSTLSNVFFSHTRPTPMPILQKVAGETAMEMMSRPIVGLIPYLIGLMMLSVGFWLVWRFLCKILRTG